jgi:hypothetical protein
MKMKVLNLSMLVSVIGILSLGAQPLFTAICENKACGLPIIEQPALTIHTNSMSKVETGMGYTNVYVTLSLLCTNCLTTNVCDSEFIIHRPRAQAVFRPPIPKRPPHPTIIPTNSVTVQVPAGHKILIVPNEP